MQTCDPLPAARRRPVRRQGPAPSAWRLTPTQWRPIRPTGVRRRYAARSACARPIRRLRQRMATTGDQRERAFPSPSACAPSLHSLTNTVPKSSITSWRKSPRALTQIRRWRLPVLHSTRNQLLASVLQTCSHPGCADPRRRWMKTPSRTKELLDVLNRYTGAGAYTASNGTCKAARSSTGWDAYAHTALIERSSKRALGRTTLLARLYSSQSPPRAVDLRYRSCNVALAWPPSRPRPIIQALTTVTLTERARPPASLYHLNKSHFSDSPGQLEPLA